MKKTIILLTCFFPFALFAEDAPGMLRQKKVTNGYAFFGVPFIYLGLGVRLNVGEAF